MPRKMRVLALPTKLRKELDKRLIESGFQDYRGLVAWLTKNGHKMSITAVWNYGKDFEERCDELQKSTAMAKAIMEASPDDAGETTEALTRLLTEQLFKMVLKLPKDPGDISVPALTRAVSDLARASVSVSRYRTEVKARIKAAADVIEGRLKGHFTPEEVADITQRIYGIA